MHSSTSLSSSTSSTSAASNHLGTASSIQPILSEQALQAVEDNNFSIIQNYLAQNDAPTIIDKKAHPVLISALKKFCNIDYKLSAALLDKNMESNEEIEDEEGFYLNVTPIHLAYFAYVHSVIHPIGTLCFYALLKNPEVDLNVICDEGFQEDTLHFCTSQYPHGITPGLSRHYVDGYALEEASVFHFAAVERDIDTVKILCETKRINLEAQVALVHNKHIIESNPLICPGEEKEGNNGIQSLGTYFVCRESIEVSRIRKVSALHLAARNGDYKMFQYLLSVKANPETKDSAGHKPRDYFELTIADLSDDQESEELVFIRNLLVLVVSKKTI